MSLYLFVAQSGRRLLVDVNIIPSPDALKQWIAEEVNIPVSRQILMTGKGKNVKQQHLVNKVFHCGRSVDEQSYSFAVQAEIFVYDKNLLSPQNDDNAIEVPSPEIPEIHEPPSTLENENSLSAWQDLFQARRTWAIGANDAVERLTSQISEQVEACEIIEQSTAVALENLRNHVSILGDTFDKTHKWAHDLLEEQAELLKEWQPMVKTLSELPVREDVTALLQPPQNDTHQPETMRSLLDMTQLEEAAGSLQSTGDDFTSRIDELQEKMNSIQQDSEQAASLAQVQWPNLDSTITQQEAATMAKKIISDNDEVLNAAEDTRSISRISRLAVKQTNDLLPELQAMVAEAGQMLHEAIGHRRNVASASGKALRQVSVIQSALGSLQQSISALSISDAAKTSFDVIEKVFRLPHVYGSVLVEAVRRTEWNDKMMNELKGVKDDLSQQRNDELRRRKKWLSTMHGFLNIDDATAASSIADVTLSTPANPWPFVSREEIFSYIEDLRSFGVDEAVQQLTALTKTLDSTTKSRRPKTNAFKNGSVHDLQQSSYLQNEDEFRSLQLDKTRLEDRLRASDSRIRKLEDVLHRQSQINRPASGMFSPITDFTPTSPHPSQIKAAPESSSRRSSVSARRLSNQNLEEKAMVQRIVGLEAQIQKLQQEAHAERRSSTESRDKMQEAESVKRDLMANFEAQRQEFEDERQRLEDDNHDLKVKMEELEEELDRILGSRDHERVKTEGSISHLRSELERMRKSANEEIDQLRRAKEHLEHELATQKEKTQSAERHAQQQRDERSALQNRNLTAANELRALQAERLDVVNSLQSTYSHLSPAGSPPDDLMRLVNALEMVAEGSAIHARGQSDELQFANAENKKLEDDLTELKDQLQSADARNEKLSSLKTQAETQTEQERKLLTSIRKELADEKAEVQRLRDKFAAGETGSETLKSQLASEERKLNELTEAKNASDNKLHALQRELEAARNETTRLDERRNVINDHLESREKKAKELSERLFQHNDRMIRMLENFGYSISRQGDGMLIQRASKANASAILEAGTPMKRTVSGSMPIQHYSDPADAQTLYWQSSMDPVAEDAAYHAFMTSLSRLDLDGTMELITKRYKDVETLAKKYQKDSRSQREKSHRLQSEAHEKIAYRSFKEGDLALFLPTRNQATRPWAAFNVGAPHYFLREQDSHKLQSRDWLLARIGKIEERVVDLSRSLSSAQATKSTAAEDGASLKSIDDENPFELSDGLRWYLIDAAEEKPGAPSTPGLGSSTIATSKVDVKGHMGRKATGTGGKDSLTAPSGAVNAAKTLHKSLDSRRSSEASRKSATVPQLRTSNSNASNNIAAPSTPLTANAPRESDSAALLASPTIAGGGAGSVVKASETDANAKGQAREDAKIFEVARPSPLRAEESGKVASNERGGVRTTRRPPEKDKTKKSGWDSLFSFQYSS